MPAPTSLAQNRRQCVLCLRYRPTERGSSHNPAHGQKHFVCRECTEKRSAT